MPDDSATTAIPETPETPDAPEEETRSTGQRVMGFCKRHWHILLLLAIMAAAMLLRLYYLSKHTEYTADSYYFLLLARSIRDTFTYTVDDGNGGTALTQELAGTEASVTTVMIDGATGTNAHDWGIDNPTVTYSFDPGSDWTTAEKAAFAW